MGLPIHARPFPSRLGILCLPVPLSMGCVRSVTVPAGAQDDARAGVAAVPCPGVPVASEATGTAFDRVFVHATAIRPNDAGQSSREWLTRNVVAVRTGAGLLVQSGARTSGSWSRCVDASCSDSRPWKLTVAAHLPKRATGRLKLDIQIDAPGSLDSPQTAAVETYNQAPVLVEFPPARGAAAQSLVIMPYLVGEQEDLGRIAKCYAHEAKGD